MWKLINEYRWFISILAAFKAELCRTGIPEGRGTAQQETQQAEAAKLKFTLTFH